MSTCPNCGAETKLQAQAGGMFYSAFDPETGERHVCPVLVAEASGVAAMREDIAKHTPKDESAGSGAPQENSGPDDQPETTTLRVAHGQRIRAEQGAKGITKGTREEIDRLASSRGRGEV